MTRDTQARGASKPASLWPLATLGKFGDEHSMRTRAGTAGEAPARLLGGMKASSDGRFGGKVGIAEFTDPRWVTLQSTQHHYPLRR